MANRRSPSPMNFQLNILCIERRRKKHDVFVVRENFKEDEFTWKTVVKRLDSDCDYVKLLPQEPLKTTLNWAWCSSNAIILERTASVNQSDPLGIDLILVDKDIWDEPLKPSGVPTPEEAIPPVPPAQLNHYRETQRTEAKISNGRYTVRDDFDPATHGAPSGSPPTGPPIEIFNITFARFAARLHKSQP
ncbi:hypothetical protein BT96DRAFT_980336 [Gymnopus androsaceus JB14]|uniref:Uncharacterized protein n=1 Tax=Gymnopus androsaceus JB14 TaxID=1447944 RepID=A0A6A4GZ06_9AGAR|nr:hypothetical protein BT96DRAFT_980336 [Gymnopus androsaceus JB14]